MVNKDFIDKLNVVCQSLEKSRGKVELFAILKMDELTDKWTVVVSADWATAVPFQDIFTELRQELIKNLGSEMQTIARISVFSNEDHLVQLLRQNYKEGHNITADQKLNGNIIHEAYILKATTWNSSA